MTHNSVLIPGGRIKKISKPTVAFAENQKITTKLQFTHKKGEFQIIILIETLNLVLKRNDRFGSGKAILKYFLLFTRSKTHHDTA